MSIPHNRLIWRLERQLALQLDPERFELRTNLGRVRRGDETYYIPDLYVVPLSAPPTIRDQPRGLEVFADPLPLVVEVWSPSTGDYDVDAKIPAYQRHSDVEIWRLHPFDRTLTVWRRQDDGSYSQSVFTSGTNQPIALPGATIDLDALFD